MQIYYQMTFDKCKFITKWRFINANSLPIDILQMQMLYQITFDKRKCFT